MQVTLQIEAHQLSDTVIDLFKTLTDEQRMELARSTIEKWFLEPYGAERIAFSKKVEQELRSRHIRIYGYGGYGETYTDDPKLTDEQIMATSEYRESMAKFRSSREEMVTSIAETAVAHYRAQVEELVKNDPSLKAGFEKVKERVTATFPQMMQTALVTWFSQQMSQVTVYVPQEVCDLKQEVEYLKKELVLISNKISQG
jgi:hypothetical protein